MAMLRKQKQQRIAAVRARSSLFQGLSPEQRAQDPYLASLDCVMEAAEDARAKLKFTGVLPAEGLVGWNYKLSYLAVSAHIAAGRLTSTGGDLWV